MKLKHIFYKNKKYGNKTILYLLRVIPVYTKKYDGHHAYYSLFGIRILKKQKVRRIDHTYTDLKLSEQDLNIAITLYGGLGDMLINANFIYLLRQKIGYVGIRIDVYEPGNLSHALFKEHKFVDNIYPQTNVEHNRYDLSIDLSRFPILRNVNRRRILFLQPMLFDFVLMWIKDNTEKYRFIDDNPKMDGMLNKYLLSRGYKRWNQFDIDHALGMTEKFPVTLFIDEPEQKYLKSLKLPKQFITIHRGVDVKQDVESIKQWPVTYYNKLIQLIRSKYPNVFIVQLGDSKDRCPEFDGVNLNLCGETSLEQLKVLLKHAALHIDGEGGMVHVRHALHGGQSVVLFGPTDPNVYGYSENVNLVGNGCIGGCEWCNENWQSCCAMGTPHAFCQYSLMPDTVWKSVSGCLEQTLKKGRK